MAHDFFVDTFDTIDGRHVLYNAKHPDKKYEVMSLLDGDSEEVADPELALGGVVKLADQCFTVFFWN